MHPCGHALARATPASSRCLVVWLWHRTEAPSINIPAPWSHHNSRVLRAEPRANHHNCAITPRAPGYIVWSHSVRRGLGLSPGPFPRGSKLDVNSNMFNVVSITRNTRWPVGRSPVAKALWWRRSSVRIRSTQNILINQTKANTWVPRGSP
jgi:hypothetical protein